MFDWNYDEKTKTLTISGSGEMENYKEKDNKTPWYGYDIRRVLIKDGVKNIGECAFLECQNLTSISIPDSVINIGKDAFYGCTGLVSVTIPGSVIKIGYGTFYNCTSLTSIVIPESVKSIGSCAFRICKSLSSVTLHENIEYIGSSPFSGTPWLAEKFKDKPLWIYKDKLIDADENLEGDIVIPDGVTYIGDYAFENCSDLTSVTIPDSVGYIGKCAFERCECLTEIKIPYGIEKIEDDTFVFCWGLRSVTIPDSVRSIGSGAFYDCSNLISVTIPDGVTSIGEGAFECCDSLTSVTIPESVVSIENNAFDSCSGLADLTLPNIAGCDYITFPCDVDEPFSKQIEMVKNKNYAVEMKNEVKYSILWQLFRLKPDEEELTAYIKKNFSRIMHFAIDHNDVETINRVCESEKLITDKNIDNLLDYSINNTQNGGNLEIQATLMNYKNEHFGDKKKRLRL